MKTLFWQFLRRRVGGRLSLPPHTVPGCSGCSSTHPGDVPTWGMHPPAADVLPGTLWPCSCWLQGAGAAWVSSGMGDAANPGCPCQGYELPHRLRDGSPCSEAPRPAPGQLSLSPLHSSEEPWGQDYLHGLPGCRACPAGRAPSAPSHGGQRNITVRQCPGFPRGTLYPLQIFPSRRAVLHCNIIEVIQVYAQCLEEKARRRSTTLPKGTSMKCERLCLFSAPVPQALPREPLECGSIGVDLGTDRGGLMCSTLHSDLLCSGGQRRAVSTGAVVAGCPTDVCLDAEHPEGAGCRRAGLLSMPPAPAGVKHPPEPSPAASFPKTCSHLIIFETGEFKSRLQERPRPRVSPRAARPPLR